MPLYAYSLSIVRGEQVPKALDAVQGAYFVTSDGGDASNGCMSPDILRSVRKHMSRRLASVPSSNRANHGTGPGGGSGGVSLSVRTAVQPASLLQAYRFDFASDCELQTQADLVKRPSGRFIIFWPGIAPFPTRGAFSL